MRPRRRSDVPGPGRHAGALPSPTTRWPTSCSPATAAGTRGLHSFFTSQIRRQYLPLGHVYTTEDSAGRRSGARPTAAARGCSELFQLLPTAPFLVSSRMVRALRLLFEIDALHPKEPHWYLATLGTEPDRQGQGIGSALLRPVLARVDEEGVPAYLESSKERNVPLYARFGFEVIDEYRSEDGEPAHLADVARAAGARALRPVGRRRGSGLRRGRRRGGLGHGHHGLQQLVQGPGGRGREPPAALGHPDPAPGQALDGDRVELGPQEGGDGGGRQDGRAVALEGERGDEAEPVDLGGGDAG